MSMTENKGTIKILDFFSGLGGFSQAFKDRGHFVNTLDNEPSFNPDFCEDIRDFIAIGDYDVVLASPPCQEYSGLAYDYRRIWKADRELWLTTLDIIQDLKPRFWVIENVKMAQWVWGRAPQHWGSYFLWGYYPKLRVPKGLWAKSFKGTHLDRKNNNRRTNEKRTPAERAKIPYELSLTLCLAIEREMRR